MSCSTSWKVAYPGRTFRRVTIVLLTTASVWWKLSMKINNCVRGVRHSSNTTWTTSKRCDSVSSPTTACSSNSCSRLLINQISAWMTEYTIGLCCSQVRTYGIATDDLNRIILQQPSVSTTMERWKRLSQKSTQRCNRRSKELHKIDSSSLMSLMRRRASKLR